MNRKLYHFPLCPFSRMVRVFLKELNLDAVLVSEPLPSLTEEESIMQWHQHVPVLMEADGVAIDNGMAICEYLDEVYAGKRSFIGTGAVARVENRAIIYRFSYTFFYEVVSPILYEKVIAFLLHKRSPHVQTIRKARKRLTHYLDFIAFQTQHHMWLAGSGISLADIVAASQLSALDYLGEVDWTENAAAKEWYSCIKSRPSMRSLLSETFPGFSPPDYYRKFDF